MSFASRLLAVAMPFASLSPALAEPPFEPQAICRTAIASIAGRDPKSIQATRNADGVMFLTYTRPVDNFVWTYRCRIEGNRITWASEPGVGATVPRTTRSSLRLSTPARNFVSLKAMPTDRSQNGYLIAI